MSAIPAWPDFSLERVSGTRAWRARTNTGRPGTPIFTLWMTGGVVGHLDEDAMRLLAEHELQEQFRKAHPNGCPGAR